MVGDEVLFRENVKNGFPVSLMTPILVTFFEALLAHVQGLPLNPDEQ